MKKIALFFMIAGVAMGSSGAVPDLYDTFDSLYANGFTFPTVSSTNGWQASDTAASVTNGGSVSGNAVILNGTVALTNSQAGSGGLRVWTDYQMNPVLGVEPLNLPTNAASFLCYFNSNGWLVVATPAGCQTYTNDIWGGHVPPATNGYVRVSVFQDYSTLKQAVLLNAQLVAQDLTFMGSASHYNQMVFQNSDSNSWLDDVWIKTNIGPTDLVGDRNGDGMNDAVELQTYGYASRTQYVGGTGYPNCPTIQMAVNAWRARDVIYVSSGSNSGDVTVTNAIPFTGGAFTNSGTLTVRTGSGVVFQNAMNWGTVNVDSNSLATFDGAVVCSNVIIRSGATVVMQSLTCSNLTVEAGAHFTCSGAFQCSGSGLFNSGAVVVFSGAVTCGGTFTVASGASVNLVQGATLVALVDNGAVTVGAGQTLSVTTASVSGGVQVTGSGTISVGGTLSVTGSGLLTITSSRLIVIPRGVDMTGTFTVDNTWGTAATMNLPFTDDFESYANNTAITTLGFRGWSASAGTVKVQNAVKHGGNNAMVVPGSTVVSNHVDSGAATRIWTDYYVQPTIGLLPDSLPTNTASFLAYVNTNGYLVVEVAGGGWVVCSNKYDNTPVTPISTGAFSRITICQELGHHTFAVFVAGDLVAQGLVSPVSLNRYSGFVADNKDDSSYIDNVSITTTVPSEGTSDMNHNGVPDAIEIHVSDTATFPPGGSLFKIR